MTSLSSSCTEMIILPQDCKEQKVLNREDGHSVCAFCRDRIQSIGHAACVDRYSLYANLSEKGFITPETGSKSFSNQISGFISKIKIR